MSSALYPPNARWLSDDVIDTTRCEVPSHRRFDRAPALYDQNLQYTSPYEHAATRDVIQAPTTSDHGTIPRYTGKRTAPPAAPDTPPRQLKAPKLQQQQLKEEDAAKLNRERRRLTQIRYRQKLKDHADTLEQQVQALRQEVQKLEFQHQTISPRIIAEATPWSVVADYFRMFRFAMTAYIPISERCNAPGYKTLHESHTHREFLQRVMAPDVIAGDERGLDAVLEYWRFISLSQPSYEVRATNVEQGPEGYIVAKTKSKVVVCEKMLRHAFPKLEKLERGRGLADKLLGQRFEASGATVFGWDNEKGRVLSVSSESDLMTPMLRLLGNAEDLALVFEGACLTLDGRLNIH